MIKKYAYFFFKTQNLGNLSSEKLVISSFKATGDNQSTVINTILRALILLLKINFSLIISPLCDMELVIGYLVDNVGHQRVGGGEMVDFDKQASGPLSFLVQWVITQSTVVFLSSKMALTSDDKFFLYSIIFLENYLFLQEHF